MTDARPPYPGTPEPPPARPASLARRLVPAVVILGAAGGLLVALDHPGSTADAAAGTDGSGLPADGVTTPTTVAPAPTTPSTAGSGASRSTTSTVPVTPTCSGATTEVTGSTVQTKYGPMQVQATLDADGTICGVTALQTPAKDRKSVSINQRAVPTLTQRALAAGGTDFSGVSGATITSNAYKKSLQAILDQQ